MSATLNRAKLKVHNEIDSRLTKTYLNLFRELSNSALYRTYSVGEFYVDRKREPDPNKVNVVVRIDVDSGFHLSVPLAQVLSYFGIRSSHFFLTHPARYYKIWKSDVPRLVYELGHEVGLHSDHYYEQLINGIDGLNKLKDDIQSLSDEIGQPIRGMCFHGHPAIDTLGQTNWKLTKDVNSKDLGLEYHDGLKSCYIAPGKKFWEPACDIRMTDYLGWSNEWGWNLYPKLPLKQLKRAKYGEIVHIVLHTKNAFYYWKGWLNKYGEQPLSKPPLIRFWFRAIQTRLRSLKIVRLSLRKSIFYRVFDILAIILAKGLGLIWPKPRTPEPDTSWETAREQIYNLGIKYWRDKLENLDMITPNGVVLEVGSGNGQWLLAFAEDSSRVIGIEPADKIREYSLSKINEYKNFSNRIEVLSAKAESIPLSDASVDAVLCAGVFMFTQQEQALSEMARVLKPGGRLCLTANGLGYFFMYVLNGLRYKSINKMKYGLLGITATLLKWSRGTELPIPKAVSENEMVHRLSRHGLKLLRSQLWIAQDLYPKKHFGQPTNFAFLALKEKSVNKNLKCAYEN